jgi:hypothetical protein
MISCVTSLAHRAGLLFSVVPVKLLQVDARAPLLLDWFIAMGDSNGHAMSLVSEVCY